MKKISAAAGAASDKLQQAQARPLRGLASPTGRGSPTAWAPVLASQQGEARPLRGLDDTQRGPGLTHCVGTKNIKYPPFVVMVIS
jgi:hypothetical protein